MPEQQSQTGRFDEMNRKIEDTSYNVRRVRDLLEGDEFAPGMVDVLKENQALIKELADARRRHEERILKLESKASDYEVRIKALEKTKERAIWTAGGMLGPAAYGLWEFLRKFFAALLVLLLFTGCMTQKRFEDIGERYWRENPELAAEWAAIRFPPLINPGDWHIEADTIYIPSKDPEVLQPDTVRIAITKTRVDTIENIARVRSLEFEVMGYRVREGVLTADNERLKKQSKVRIWWIIGLAALLLLSHAIRLNIPRITNLLKK